MLIEICRYSDGMKLLNCRNVAGLTAAKLAAKHGHVACAQLFNALKKLGDLGVGGAAGDGRLSVHETPAAAAVAAEDADEEADGGGSTWKDLSDALILAVVKPTAVDGDQASNVLPEIVETLGTVPDIVTTHFTQSTRRCKSALPAARYGKQH